MNACEQYLDDNTQCGKPASYTVCSGQAIEYRCQECVDAARALPENEGVEFFPLLPSSK